MKIFRWKVVIPLLIFLVSVSIICRFFVNSIVKNIIISFGQSIFSSKVDIGYLKISFKDSSIEIKGLQVANKNNPWKNLFEIDKIKFDIKFLPLLSKKIIIDDVSVEGIKWATKRKTYGGLPPRKLKKIQKSKIKEKDSYTYKLMSQLSQQVKKEISSLAIVKNIKELEEEFKTISLEKVIDKMNLETIKLIEDIKDDYLTKYEAYKINIQKLNLENQIQDTKAFINDLSNIKIEKIEDLKILQDRIKQLNGRKKSLQETIVQIKDLKNNIEKDLKEPKIIYEKIRSSLDKDYKNTLQKLKLPQLTKANISKAIFGEIWIDRVNTAVYYFHLLRKYMPARKKEEKIKIERAKGIDVVFPKENVFPNFWAKKITVSWTTGGFGKEQTKILTMKGNIKDICSDPVLINKPTTLEIKSETQNVMYSIEGVFDHTKITPKDILIFSFKNVNIKNLGLTLIPQIKDGISEGVMKFSLEGEFLDCDMKISIKSIEFFEQEIKDDLDEILNKLLYSVREFQITARLYGKLNELKVEADSTLDDIIFNNVKALYTQKIQQLQERIKLEIEKIVEEKKSEFLKEYLAKREQIISFLNENEISLKNLQMELQKKIDEINRYSVDFTQQQKKKLEEELKKKLFR